jgi:threonine synthase
VLAYLDVRERIGWESYSSSPLAVASCGNAALAAATLARAARRQLDVFVPEAADPVTVHRLEELGAVVTVCERRRGVSGDPSVSRFRESVRQGALPFTCQGNLNGLTIEGGQTLGYEMDARLREEGRSIDRLFVQVGGGALASSLLGAFRESRDAGLLDALPRVHTVQTAGGHPLERAYTGLTERVLARIDAAELRAASDPETRADLLRDRSRLPLVEAELRYAATHRSEFMWPWERTPESLAEGILDDETYDWLAVLRGMIESGGYPLVVDESTIQRANDLAAASAPRPVSFTGSAGLAGLLQMLESGWMDPGENVAILWTGARRGRGG